MQPAQQVSTAGVKGTNGSNTAEERSLHDLFCLLRIKSQGVADKSEQRPGVESAKPLPRRLVPPNQFADKVVFFGLRHSPCLPQVVFAGLRNTIRPLIKKSFAQLLWNSGVRASPISGNAPHILFPGNSGDEPTEEIGAETLPMEGLRRSCRMGRRIFQDYEGKFHGSLAFHLVFEFQHSCPCAGCQAQLPPTESHSVVSQFKTPKSRRGRP